MNVPFVISISERARARAHAYTPPPGAVYIGIVYVGFDDVKFN